MTETATSTPSTASNPWAATARFSPRLALGLARNQDFNMSERPRFHLAFPVRDLSEARAFYGDLLGCPEGRSSDDWVDFDFFGHQIVAHLSPNEAGHKAHSDVDGDQVPVRHFGTILSMTEWKRLAARLTEKKVDFIIEPGIRFEGLPGEQATFFFLDPSGNALEFKAFHDDSAIFAR
ncbi:MAG TPA: VOC family protein [Rhizomicrobium sp.]|nr:VOC family protein [Rhizomicrobium sp.]